MRIAGIAALTLFVMVSGEAAAQAGGQGAQGCGMQDYLSKLGASEASNRYDIRGGAGNNFLGRYQMGASALVDAGYARPGSTNLSNIQWTGKDGVGSINDFLSNSAIQDKAYNTYASANWGYAKNAGFDKYVGQRLPDGTVVTESSILFAMQFGSVRVGNYFQSGGQCNKSSSDGNGVCVGEYLRRGSGYDISAITGNMSSSGGASTCDNPAQAQNTPWDGDKTSKTCDPTVRMLQSIDCSAYPPALMGFCQAYKPLQMTMPECQAAERYAENAPPSGQHKDMCERQTFGDGTSSWSYVLACANVPTPPNAPGDASKTTALGTGDDPACIQRLEARGIQFSSLGKVSNGFYGGQQCIVPNAVRYRGHAVPLGSTLTMDCSLAERLEDFGEIMKGMGVTGYKNLGSLSHCRGINTSRVTGGAKLSLHGTGHAIDISAFEINGQMTPTSRYFSDTSTRPLFDRIVQTACTTFTGVLAFRYYRGRYGHIHFQVKEATRCDPPG